VAAAAAVIVEFSAGRSATAAASERATWGQILMICEELEGRHPSRYFVELYDPLSNRFAVRRPVMHKGRDSTAAAVTGWAKCRKGPDCGRLQWQARTARFERVV